MGAPILLGCCLAWIRPFGGIAISLLTPANMASQDFFYALFVSISQHCIKTEIILFNLVHSRVPRLAFNWELGGGCILRRGLLN